MLLPFTFLENIRWNFKTASNLLMIMIFCITPKSSVIFNNIIFSEKSERTNIWNLNHNIWYPRAFISGSHPMTSAAPSKKWGDKEKTFSLSLSLSLKLFYSWIATEWELAKAFNSSTALRNQYTVCIEFGEHTEEAEIKQRCFIEHTNLGFQPESFYFKELINFFDLKPNCCIMRPGKKIEEKKIWSSERLNES